MCLPALLNQPATPGAVVPSTLSDGGRGVGQECERTGGGRHELSHCVFVPLFLMTLRSLWALVC